MPTLFDSIILVFRDRITTEVIGTRKDARRFMRPWTHWAIESKGEREVRFRGRDIIYVEVVTIEEKRRLAAEAAAKAEAELKKNPHPGKEPILRTPTGRIVPVPR